MTIVRTIALHRTQRRHGTGFVAQPAEHAPVRRPARVAIMLALAHYIQRQIYERRVRDQSDAARRLGVTPPRMSQLLALLRLSPDLQEQILFLEALDGLEPLTERDLRPITRPLDWSEQRALWGELVAQRALPLDIRRISDRMRGPSRSDSAKR